MVRFAWPDNVRELENVICSVLLRRRRGDIDLNDLPAAIRRAASHRPLTRMEQIERDAIMDALNAAGDNEAEAAESLGISRTTLYRKLVAYGLSGNLTLLGREG
jgi:transcriptional regulator of acetoin/glycerol metabolism